jgi:hypothetical protein
MGTPAPPWVENITRRARPRPWCRRRATCIVGALSAAPRPARACVHVERLEASHGGLERVLIVLLARAVDEHVANVLLISRPPSATAQAHRAANERTWRSRCSLNCSARWTRRVRLASESAGAGRGAEHLHGLVRHEVVNCELDEHDKVLRGRGRRAQPQRVWDRTGARTSAPMKIWYFSVSLEHAWAG